MELKALQNGSDIRGIAIAIPGGKPVDLSEKAAYAIGRALVRLLRKRLGKSELKILAGRDSRLSGPSLCRAIEAGIAAEGARSYARNVHGNGHGGFFVRRFRYDNGEPSSIRKERLQVL